MHCVCTCVWDLCSSFVFLSQIEPDSYVRYPVMEPGGTDKERSRRADRRGGTCARFAAHPDLTLS